MVQTNNSQVATHAVATICKHVNRWIDSYRSDLYVAVALDKFVEMINGFLKATGEDIDVTKEDVKRCLRWDDIKVVDVDGREVLWLWGGWRLYDLIDRAAKYAAKDGEVAVIAP